MVQQETRLWDTKNKRTVVMRIKKETADYRFFQDPDLPIIEISEEWIERIKKGLPELPLEKFKRFCAQKKLSPYEAEILVDDIKLANYFDQATQFSTSKNLINWVLRDLMGYLKEKKISLVEYKITPKQLAELVDLLDNRVINNYVAKEVFTIIAQTGKTPKEVVKEKGLEQINSVKELEKIVKEVIKEQTKQVEQYKAGKEKLFGFFVGKIMQNTKGKGNPKIIQKLLKKYLS